MTDPGALLTEAGAALTRAQALIERAGEELGFPFAEPMQFLATDVKAIRRRLRNATITATGP
jgi:hypothetical protein